MAKPTKPAPQRTASAYAALPVHTQVTMRLLDAMLTGVTPTDPAATVALAQEMAELVLIDGRARWKAERQQGDEASSSDE